MLLRALKSYISVSNKHEKLEVMMTTHVKKLDAGGLQSQKLAKESTDFPGFVTDDHSIAIQSTWMS